MRVRRGGIRAAVAAITVAAATVALTAGSGLLASSADAAEAVGTWGLAQSLPGLGTFSGVLAMSCPDSGYCEAAGIYQPSQGGSAPFVVSERNGTWGTPQAIPGLTALNVGLRAYVFGLSCASPGNCAVSGEYTDASFHFRAYVADEHAGTWDQAIQVPGTATLDTGRYASSTAISCTAPGDCTLAGEYFDSAEVTHVFVADEVNGTWQNAIELPGPLLSGDAHAYALSCSAPGDCAVGGSYGTGIAEAYVASEVNGTWQNAIEVPGTAALNVGGNAVVDSVSCSAPGTCAAGGGYSSAPKFGQALVADEVNGVWQDAIDVPGAAAPGRPGLGAVISLSCAPGGTCAAGGVYGFQPGKPGQAQAFVDSQIQPAGTATSLRLSARTITAGRERNERLTITVTPGTPYGLAIVTAIAGPGRSARLCLATVRAGTGTCRLTARQLAPGTYQITARYLGNNTLTPSVSPARTLRVRAAAAPRPGPRR